MDQLTICLNNYSAHVQIRCPLESLDQAKSLSLQNWRFERKPKGSSSDNAPVSSQTIETPTCQSFRWMTSFTNVAFEEELGCASEFCWMWCIANHLDRECLAVWMVPSALISFFSHNFWFRLLQRVIAKVDRLASSKASKIKKHIWSCHSATMVS